MTEHVVPGGASGPHAPEAAYPIGATNAPQSASADEGASTAERRRALVTARRARGLEVETVIPVNPRAAPAWLPGPCQDSTNLHFPRAGLTGRVVPD